MALDAQVCTSNIRRSILFQRQLKNGLCHVLIVHVPVFSFHKWIIVRHLYDVSLIELDVKPAGAVEHLFNALIKALLRRWKHVSTRVKFLVALHLAILNQPLNNILCAHALTTLPWQAAQREALEV